MIRALLVGDVVAGTGRRLLVEHLESIIDHERIDFVIANIENAAGGRGLTVKIMAELDELPVDVWTTGNHVWDKKDGVSLLDGPPCPVASCQLPSGCAGTWLVR